MEREAVEREVVGRGRFWGEGGGGERASVGRGWWWERKHCFNYCSNGCACL